MTSSDDHPYQVGRGRPPLASRFRPGQSGNPNGRPRRRQSFKQDIADALDAALPDVEGEMTKQRKLAQNLVNDALARDPLAMKIVAPIALKLNDGEGDHDDQTSREEQELITQYSRREDLVVRTEKPSPDGGDDD